MICEDCLFFIDEMCTDDMEGYINKETGLSVCRYNPNAISCIERELLTALRGLFVATNALLIGLHDALGISPNDDDFPPAMREALEQARGTIAIAEGDKVMEDKGIYEPLRWMFEEARANDLWFYSDYQRLWLSPDELEAANRKGRFRWGTRNWVLRHPRERVAELVEEHEEAHVELESMRQRIK